MIYPLTSLRFVFALMVFVTHLGFMKSENAYFLWLKDFVFAEGYIGVSFFFILSGFILSFTYKNLLLAKQIPLKVFFSRRIGRIYPLHLFTLLLAVPLTYPLFFADPSTWITAFVSHLFLIQSFIPDIAIYFAFNQPSWSISNELFFYSLFPFLTFYFARHPSFKRWGWLSLVFIPIGITLCPDAYRHALFYINPLLRISDFFIGIFLYEIYESKVLDHFFKTKFTASLSEFVAIMTFIIAFSFHAFIPEPYRYACYYWIPMSLIVFVFANQKGILSDILSNNILVFLGEISFSSYMIHRLLISYCRYLDDKFSLINNDYILAAGIFALNILFSYLCYRYIEQPCNRYIKKVVEKTTSFPKPLKAPL